MLGGTRQLRQRNHRNVQLPRHRLQSSADVDDLKKKLDTGSKEVEGFGGKLEKFGKVAAAAFAAAAAAAAAYAVKLAVDGGIAVKVLAFGGKAEVVVPWHTVKSAEQANTLFAKIKSVPRRVQIATEIGAALDTASSHFATTPCAPERKVIANVKALVLPCHQKHVSFQKKNVKDALKKQSPLTVVY